MAPHIFPRQDEFEKTLDRYIAGSLIAGVIVFVVLLCLRLCFLHFRRPKANKKRKATALRLECGAENNSSSTSYEGLLMSINMPEKSITRNPYSYRLLDQPSEYTPLPTSSTLSLQVPSPPCSTSFLRPADARHSRASSGFSGYTVYTQYRSLPGLTRSSRLSFAGFTSSSLARPVHQPFEPTLPDELTLRCGEYISVLQSFDDGWCVVARDTSRSSLVSAGTKTNGDNVDIGIVPTWVFAEPLEGVACTRSFRSTSLNALRFGPNPGYARDTVTSANFI